jgi:hypothetical protein
MTTTFRYYPQFFRSNRPYAKGLEDNLAKARRENRVTPKEGFGLVGDQLCAAYLKLGIKPTDPDFPLQEFSQEAAGALTYGQWWLDGSVVFEFEPALSEAFMRSDVDDLRLSDLNFPYRCFYMHFGPQSELPLYGGELYAEGAYLIYDPAQSVRVILTARYEAPWLGWSARAKECYQLKIDARHFDIDLGTALDVALAEDMEDLNAVIRNKASINKVPNMDVATGVEAYLEAHKQNQDTFRKALRLVVNGLSYLTAYPEDAREAWQPGTPEKMRLKAEHAGNDKERGRAKSKLISQGFMPIHLAGYAFQASAGPDGDHRKAHWRRGHWRRQAHGVGLALRKLIWIQPTRISGPDEDEGKVFKVVES